MEPAPWKMFGEGPAVTKVEDQTNKKADQATTKIEQFTSADIRFTAKGDIVYAMTLAIPSGKISISSFSSKNQDLKIASVELVGSK